MQGEITFHLNSGKKESWIITEADSERLLAQLLARSPGILQFITVDDGREVLVCQERIEVMEFNLINAGVVRQEEVVTESDWASMPRVSVTDLLAFVQDDPWDEDVNWRAALGLNANGAGDESV